MTALSTELTYPFDHPPEAGQWLSVAEGIYWLQMPLPMALDHINLYVLEDDEGWYIVDTGMGLRDTQKYWLQLINGPMAGKPLKAVICTHMHPDHCGQAGWLCNEWRVPLYMSAAEYLSARTFGAPSEGGMSWTGKAHYLRAGVAPETLERLASRLRGFSKIIEPMPLSFRRMRDGDTLSIGGREWRVMTGSGHSPEHVSLYCEGDKLLLSGDQIIPRITSNVSVMPVEPDGNPLAEWLDSLHRFRNDVHADTLVLPAHNAPFYGVHQRLDYLVAHHQGHLAAIEKACETPKAAIELFDVLFARKLDESQLPLALGEAIAHLHYLYYQGRMERVIGDDGICRYRSTDPEHSPYTGAPYEPGDAPFEV
ncbi:MAG: MBL fold metallo-hydrolase [Spongiibacter sp.]|nr:MBL fold metallo-hydrolase [Spongiibacter sp.]